VRLRAGSKDPAYTFDMPNAGSKDPAYTFDMPNARSEDPAYTFDMPNAGSEDPAYTGYATYTVPATSSTMASTPRPDVSTV
jgi:hypothetical protein